MLAWILPTLLVVSMAWIAYLALSNVRERFTEIATLRTLGLGTSKMLGLFLGRAALQGLVGALVGLAAAWIFSDGLVATEWLVAAIGAPVLAMAAAWLPCLVAASRDPADVLRQD